jgi:subtilisin
MTASAFGFIAICIVVIGAWDIFTEARSKTPASQKQMSPAELSAAIEAQREASAKLTRSATFDQRLQKLREKAQKKGTVSVIVKVRAAFRPEGQISSAAEVLAQRTGIGEAQDQMLSWLRYVPSSLKRYKYIPSIAASVDATGLEQLQASSEALDISEDKPMRLALAESLPRIGAPRAWAGGFKGSNKTIAVLDSGVDKNHPWLAGKVVSEACYSTNNSAEMYSSLCPGGVAESTDPDSGVPCTVLGGAENCGHGTHIAGIAAGRAGVAYGANIISIKVMSRVDDSEACRGQAPCLLSKSSDMIKALNRVFELRAVYNYDIAAANISLAASDVSDLFPSHCDSVLAGMTEAINQLRSVNIATVVASGNDASPDAIMFPACISSAVSVGATSDGSDPNAPNDTVPLFSNSASFLNLLAPGTLITSSVPGGGVAGGSGTSQAAAHVSGAWAMLKEKYPDATVDQVLSKLTSFGAPITDPRNGVTKPRIQIDAALEVAAPPDNWIGEYYNNPNLADAPVLVRGDGGGFIDRYLNGASPAPGFVGAENYSIRWTRKLTLTAGTYRFSVTSDDGARLYIDDQLKINQWPNSPSATTNVNVDLTSGVHDIRLEYYQSTGPAQARMIWGILDPDCSQAAPDDHWKGEYFNNANLAGSPVVMRDDGSNDSLNFNWGIGAPSSGCNLTLFSDYFSVRWMRTVNLGAATYRFTVFGDNGVRLWVDNQLRIDRWTETVGTNTANVQLSAGPHEIKLEYFETYGEAAVSLSWMPSPDPPSNLVASAASPLQINLSWSDNSGNENGFKIERWNGSSYSQINTVGANVTTYADSGLAPSTTYYYRVRAYNSIGDSGYSNESSASTFTCSYNVSPTSAEFDYWASSGLVTVSSAAGCPWTAAAAGAWLHIIAGASGTGNGVVEYSVDYYSARNGHRWASLEVAGHIIRVDQFGYDGGDDDLLLQSSASTPKQIIPQQQSYPEAATNTPAPTGANKQTGMPPPSGSDAVPRAKKLKLGASNRWLVTPLGRAGLTLLIASCVWVLLLRNNWQQSRRWLATAAASITSRLREQTVWLGKAHEIHREYSLPHSSGDLATHSTDNCCKELAL